MFPLAGGLGARALVWPQNQIGIVVPESLPIQKVASQRCTTIFSRPFAPELIVMHTMILQGLRHAWLLGMPSRFALLING